jgi:hypothetical protein
MLKKLMLSLMVLSLTFFLSACPKPKDDSAKGDAGKKTEKVAAGQKTAKNEEKTKAEEAAAENSDSVDMKAVREKFCAAITKGDAEGEFNLMEPKMLEMMKKMITEHSGKGPDAWAQMINDMKKEAEKATICTVDKTEEAACDTSVLKEAEQAKVMPEKCAYITITVESKESGKNSQQLPMIMVGGQWYLVSFEGK